MTTSVRSAALAKQEERAAEVTPAAHVRNVIERQLPRIASVMPRSVTAERFTNLVLTAVKASPQLMQCFETQQGELSVLLAAMQAATVDLKPNTPTQHAWLLPRRNKGVMECQLSIGYRGYLELARRSGQIKTLFAEVVRQGEHFTYSRGLEADVLEHIPGDGTGALTHAYAVVRYMNGGYDFRVLRKADVEARRARSDSYKNAKQYSPWTTEEEAMWRKSAVRALVPFLPLADEVHAAVDTDDRALKLGPDDSSIIPDGYQADMPDAIEAGSAEDAANTTGDAVDEGHPAPDGKPAT